MGESGFQAASTATVSEPLAVDLAACLFAVDGGQLNVLIATPGLRAQLPTVRLAPVHGRTLEGELCRGLATRWGIAPHFLTQVLTTRRARVDGDGALPGLAVGFMGLLPPPTGSSPRPGLSWLPVRALPELSTDHRDIVRSSRERLESAMRARPIEPLLLPAEFTLLDLQETAEAILGPNLHKQNFRRVVEASGMIEPTGAKRHETGGRPARLYRLSSSGISRSRTPRNHAKTVALIGTSQGTTS